MMLWNIIFGCVKLNSYKYLSEVYDALMDDADNQKWSYYIFNILNSMQIKPPCRIFETACGTGRITLSLAQTGYNVIAI